MGLVSTNTRAEWRPASLYHNLLTDSTTLHHPPPPSTTSLGDTKYHQAVDCVVNRASYIDVRLKVFIILPSRLTQGGS